MTTTTIAGRLASDGLRQHLYAQPATVTEACQGMYFSCFSSYECCAGLWCSWGFICERAG
ncbi:hypothetical protein ACIA5C_00610 [Actinoplanes sp. NPDC051343]|jgi:hypothetical protein|uniref:hypothetical protein n=1 Tax=Actinoplanes sp. NPDC051343 TaxID=3363906 RepID=UPI0037BDBAE8